VHVTHDEGAAVAGASDGGVEVIDFKPKQRTGSPMGPWWWSMSQACSCTIRPSEPHLLVWRFGSQKGRVIRHNVLEAMETFAEIGSEVDDVLAARTRAILLLGHHRLRAAALLVQEQAGVRIDFVCLDARLCEAAEREGLRILTV